VHNDEKLNVIAMTRAEEFFGAQNVDVTELRMGAEDFGYYSQKIPGCFFRLGTGNRKKGISSGVHTPTFDIDDDAIEYGMAAMALFGATLNLE
jgi:hippurate hydrolase